MKRHHKTVGAVATASALAVGSIALAAPSASAAPPTYSVTLLQPLPGKTDSVAQGINSLGDVVGRSSTDDAPEATMWRTSLATGSFVGAGGASSAYGISADRTVVGGFTLDADDPLGERQSYWRQGGTAAGVMTQATNHQFADISENAVGILNWPPPGSGPHVATSPTSVTPLPRPASAEWASARGISDNGKLVAGNIEQDGQNRATLWEVGGSFHVKPPVGLAATGLLDVNDSGNAVGSVNFSAGTLPYAFPAAGDPVPLPTLAGHTSSRATVINNSGMSGGVAFPDEGGLAVAIVWSDGMVHDLNNLIAGDHSGYTLVTVTDINAAGQIVGEAALPDGTSRGYVATPVTASSIYTTPGTHSFNGREWKTSCEPYSQTTRCRTEIVATQVHYVNGQYTRVTDWAFNNLTYTPSARSLWTHNPLGHAGEWTADDGRRWRTECDTPATGSNACRSYAMARVASATAKPGGGYTYSVESKWVFNNIVIFS